MAIFGPREIMRSEQIKAIGDMADKRSGDPRPPDAVADFVDAADSLVGLLRVAVQGGRKERNGDYRPYVAYREARERLAASVHNPHNHDQYNDFDYEMHYDCPACYDQPR